nr:nitroreductase [uncultured Sharpea sp.]
MAKTLDVLKQRRSCRAFTNRPVEKEKMAAILEAGTYAPTGMGKQSPIIIVIKDPKVKEMVVVLANKERPTYIYDGSLVMGNMMNAAADLGLGSCWIHRAKEEFETEYGKSLLKRLGIEGDYEGIGHLVIGYPAKEPAQPVKRKENYIYEL